MIEHRRLPRVPFHHRVVVRQTAAGANQNVWAGDLSLGGMFIHTPSPPPVGSLVQVALDTAVGLVELGEARVRWRQEARGAAESGGFGVEFTQLTPSGRPLLEAFIKHGGVQPPADKSSEPKTDPAVPFQDEAEDKDGD